MSAPLWTERNSPAYRRITLALFLAGLATFSLIYCVQPLLPVLSGEFHVSSATGSLALSLTTGFLAFSILLVGAGGEAFLRRDLMFGSICGAAIMNIIAGFAPNWPVLLLARAVEGLLLGGVPAVAMAYLAEEIHPAGLGSAMGLYVGGTAFGGMLGRVGTGLVVELAGWRTALVFIGGAGLLAALGFRWLLPASRNFTRQPGLNWRFHIRAWSDHLSNPGLLLLFLTGLLCMGSFATLYNYAGFRLLAPPYALTQTENGLIFTVYLLGMTGSWVAGGLADRLGRAPVLLVGLLTMLGGMALTLSAALPLIIAGIAVVTLGFFVSHAIASGWVGRKAAINKGHAAALYLLAYYIGSSIMGSSGGWFWDAGGWPAVIGFSVGQIAIAALIAVKLRHLP